MWRNGPAHTVRAHSGQPTIVRHGHGLTGLGWATDDRDFSSRSIRRQSATSTRPTVAATTGYRARYTLATTLVNVSVEAADDKQSNKTIARYGRADLLCINELRYFELARAGQK